MIINCPCRGRHCPLSPHSFLSFSFVCSLQRHLRLGCPRMDTSFKKWVSATPARTLECSRQYISSSFEPITKGSLHLVIHRRPVMHHCAVGWSRKGSQPSHRSAINNELFSACYDNGGFITVKPRRSTQLVCAAQAGGTQRASIASPRLPQTIIPSCNTPIHSADSQKAPCCPPPPPPRCLFDTFNLIETQLRCCWQARTRQRFSLSKVGCSRSRRRFFQRL